jgi:hypothetical protein
MEVLAKGPFLSGISAPEKTSSDEHLGQMPDFKMLSSLF